MNNPLYCILAWLAPDLCLVCSKEAELLCDNCRPKLLALGPGCFYCGKLGETPEYPNQTCRRCQNSHELYSITVRTFYKSEIAKLLLHKLKFERSQAAAKVIASELSGGLPFIDDKTVIVPIPTANRRVRLRGYDQSVLIARVLAKQAKLPCQNLLLRVSSSEQKHLNRTQRKLQASQAFVIRQPERILNTQNYMLVDDVTTTGATLDAAAQLLKKYGAEKVSAIVFAAA